MTDEPLGGGTPIRSAAWEPFGRRRPIGPHRERLAALTLIGFVTETLINWIED